MRHSSRIDHPANTLDPVVNSGKACEMSHAEIAMTIPAESRFVSTARVTAANLAAELDFSIDEIEELRMGANEVVSLLIEFAQDNGRSEVQLRYVVDDAGIEVIGSVVDAVNGAALAIDFLAEQILDSVVDAYEVAPASVRLVKRRAST